MQANFGHSSLPNQEAGATQGQTSVTHSSALYMRFTALILSGVATFVLTSLGWLFFLAAAPQLVGWRTVAITSGSMQPRINVGDAVIVEPGIDTLEPGRLVTFKDPSRAEKLVTHRLVAYNNDGTWTTKGDANANNDTTPIPTESIVGSAKGVIPYVGYPTVWRQTGNHLPLVGLAAMVLLSVVLLPASSRLEAKYAPAKRDPKADLKAPSPMEQVDEPTPDLVERVEPVVLPQQLAWHQRVWAYRGKINQQQSHSPAESAPVWK